MTGQAEEFDLRSTALMFWRHRRFLLASIILLGGLATLLGSQRPPMYTAETLVALSPQESRILSSEAVEPSLTPNEQTIGTQISIIGSRQHARRTVEELRLAEVPEFAGQDVEGVPGKLWRLARAQVEDWLGRSWMASATTSEVPPAPAAGQPVGEEAVTSAFLKRLAVRNVPRSLVIGIAFTSRDPELAARAANTVAELYVADQRQAKLEATTGASRWLETRVDQLRAELIEAERAVERFRADNDLVELGGQTLVGENLADLNRQLQAADADLAEKEALLKIVRDRAKAGGELEPLSEAESSPLLQHLREQQAELRRQEAQLVSSLGERHPRMRDLAAERTDVNEKIAAELQRIVRQLENGAAVVRSRQRTLRADLAQAKQRSTVDRQAEVRLRELEREAAAIREQYQAFLERFKQTTD
jgi:succinoglycan biosynthesis transport protein ExoP